MIIQSNLAIYVNRNVGCFILRVYWYQYENSMICCGWLGEESKNLPALEESDSFAACGFPKGLKHYYSKVQGFPIIWNTWFLTSKMAGPVLSSDSLKGSSWNRRVKNISPEPTDWNLVPLPFPILRAPCVEIKNTSIRHAIIPITTKLAIVPGWIFLSLLSL